MSLTPDRRTVTSVALTSCLLACSGPLRQAGPIAGAALVPVRWSDLLGWAAEDHAAAYATFLSSCQAVVRAPPQAGKSVPDDALKGVCERALVRGALDARSAQAFFEASFEPLRVDAEGESAGLITGYYVPIFAGSLQRTQTHPTPIYGKPSTVTELAYTREEIESGALDGKGLELLWVDPIDAFFAQVQGSARVQLPDGSEVRLEYTAKNEHPYSSIGRVLIERGVIPREEMSMQRIREWMTANPEAAVEVRRQNKSFVFFGARPSSGPEEGLGAQGLPLVPARSIAVDNKLHAYGTPMFIDAKLPIDGEDSVVQFRHLMVAMDTGTAIVGPARADIYWGVGERAAEIAGRLKHHGTFTLLVPRPSDSR